MASMQAFGFGARAAYRLSSTAAVAAKELRRGTDAVAAEQRRLKDMMGKEISVFCCSNLNFAMVATCREDAGNGNLLILTQ